MSSGMSSDLPQRLRARRKALGLTLSDVATAAKLSVGFISQIERGIATPSLTSLVEIAHVLQLDPGALLGIPARTGATIARDQRTTFSLTDSGVSYERISSGDGAMKLNGLVTHFPPGHMSAETTRHEGEELFYVLAGELELELNGQRTRLRPGDTAHYSSALPHAMRNPTDQTTTVIWVGTINLFGNEHDPGTPVHGSQHKTGATPNGQQQGPLHLRESEMEAKK